MKKYVVLSIILLAFAGCSKKSEPLLLGPSASTTSISATCTQVDNSKFPENRAFVSVIDQNANPLATFALGNFSVAENDKPEIVFAVKPVDNIADPLSVVIVIDQSGSMAITTDSNKTRLEVAKEAAVAFINEMGSVDEAEIILFSNNVEVRQVFTSNKTLLVNAINSADYVGATAFYDAVARGVDDLAGRRGRKVVVGLTDGADNSSVTYSSYDSLINHANSQGLPVYTVGIVSGVSDADPAALKSIADNTGGRYFTDTQGSLTTSFKQIFKQINSQVQVEFKSLVGDKPRTLKVYINYGTMIANCSKSYSY